MRQSKSFVTIVGAAVAAAFVGGCTSFQAESYWGPAHKLSGLGATYAWRPGAKCEANTGRARFPDAENALLELIDVDFAAKGYRRADETKPDVYVCYRLGKVATQAETGLASWDDAIIEVDLTDPVSGGLVWRGRVIGPIDYAASPGARKGRMETAVRQLLEPLPNAGSR